MENEIIGAEQPELHEETLQEVLPEEIPPEKPRTGPVRPEAVLGILALLAAVLLGVMFLLCRPYISAGSEEDPEAFIRHHDDTEIVLPMPEKAPETQPQETPAPTEPVDLPDLNPYGRHDFQYNRHNYLICEETDSYSGIDVSAYQGNIDWEKVKRAGIQFAIIRLGYRGYGTGKLVEDEYAQKNLEGATQAGLPIGVYFFSQALNIREVDEEIAYMLKILGDYELDMPIILDWEIPTSDARTANMDARTLTDLQLHFCETMTEKGYIPMVYFNWNMSSRLLHLTELEEYPFWLALYQDQMTYPYKVEMWQYTDNGKVPGISGPVDINVYMPRG